MIRVKVALWLAPVEAPVAVMGTAYVPGAAEAMGVITLGPQAVRSKAAGRVRIAARKKNVRRLALRRVASRARRPKGGNKSARAAEAGELLMGPSTVRARTESVSRSSETVAVALPERAAEAGVKVQVTYAGKLPQTMPMLSAKLPRLVRVMVVLVC